MVPYMDAAIDLCYASSHGSRGRHCDAV